ncbi:MAG: hypothetical protein ABI480_09460 [Chitinophagaceae bacterium]
MSINTIMLRRIFILLLFFIPVISFSQDLTGTWEGAGGGCSYAKICIMRYKDTYIGYTYDVGMGHCKANLIATYNTDNKKFKGINNGMIEKTFLHTQSRYNLSYVILDGKEKLTGSILPKARALSLGLGQPISYTRVSDKVDTTVFMQEWLTKNVPAESVTDSLAIADTPVTIDSTTTTTAIVALPLAKVPSPADSIIIDRNKRTTDTISVISTNEKELIIKLMDNGVVDGDMVSIIHNGKVIAERIGVTETPYELKIPIGPDNETQEIVLVAHNVGSIPPNTALVIIDTPSKQYRLTASTDLGKNAMIIFKYKE